MEARLEDGGADAAAEDGSQEASLYDYSSIVQNTNNEKDDDDDDDMPIIMTQVDDDENDDDNEVLFPVSKKRSNTASSSEEDDSNNTTTPPLHCSSITDDNNASSSSLSFSERWTKTVKTIQQPINRVLVAVSVHAARYPRIYVTIGVLLAIGLLLTGLYTNFVVESSEADLWTPQGSLPDRHNQWIRSEFQPYSSILARERAEREEEEERAKRLEEKAKAAAAAANNSTNATDLIDDEDYKKISGGYLRLLLHARGGNVVTLEGMTRLFQVLDTVRATPDYDDYCHQYSRTQPCPSPELFAFGCQLNGIPVGEGTRNVCEIGSVAAVWFHNTTLFEKRAKSDEDVQHILSLKIYRDQIRDQYNVQVSPFDDKSGDNPNPLDVRTLVGNPKYKENEETGMDTLVFGTSFWMSIDLPGPYGNDQDWGRVDALQGNALHRVLQLQSEWDADSSQNNPFTVEVTASGSWADEFLRSISADLPLLVIVIVVMITFTCLVFWKPRDWLHSRCLLGFGAVACVICSVMTSYGILFIAGVPFTSLAQVAIFIVVGVGLDDAFIIFTAYDRTDVNLDTVERIRITMEEVSISIFMTTATSVTAFALGCVSKVPVIQWLCIYSSTTLGIDFIFQVTFFAALIVLDERRIQRRRRDCCLCCTVKEPQTDTAVDSPEQSEDDADALAIERGDSNSAGVPDTRSTGKAKEGEELGDSDDRHVSARVMSFYADKLLISWVKVLVVLAFAALFAVCVVSATRLEVYFDWTAVLPSDSYLARLVKAEIAYSNRGGPGTTVYFRDVNQSDPDIQAQMWDYVNDLVSIDGITDPPYNFWLRDYQRFVADNAETLGSLSSNDTLRLFLGDPSYNYNGSIMVDEHFNIIASRTSIIMDEVDTTVVDEYLQAYEDQAKVTLEQPINQNRQELAFFMYSYRFLTWEFLYITPSELFKSSILGLVAVSAMSIIFMPHWSGVLFVAPLVVILYADLMGVLQFAGISINSVTYICLVMAIGLLVDYVMHVTLRYYESAKSTKNEKVKEVLETMGASVLLGGLSTFLGIMPLVFSKNDFVNTFFVAFVGVVTLGISHGLILLPVLLSWFGPK